MKKIKTSFSIIAILLAPLLVLGQELKIDSLPQSLLGTWVYSYSTTVGLTIQAPADKHHRPYQMVFAPCNDAIALKNMPPAVVNMRKDNVFKNMQCQTTEQDSSKPTDTYYPVLHNQKDYTTASISIYGNRYKDGFTLYALSDDTLVLSYGSVITVDGNEYRNVRHIYTRK